MAERRFIHATPTLFNAGTMHVKIVMIALTGPAPNEQLFLGCAQGNVLDVDRFTIQSDSISGIYDTLKECALISK